MLVIIDPSRSWDSDIHCNPVSICYLCYDSQLESVKHSSQQFMLIDCYSWHATSWIELWRGSWTRAEWWPLLSLYQKKLKFKNELNSHMIPTMQDGKQWAVFSSRASQNPGWKQYPRLWGTYWWKIVPQKSCGPERDRLEPPYIWNFDCTLLDKYVWSIRMSVWREEIKPRLY